MSPPSNWSSLFHDGLLLIFTGPINEKKKYSKYVVFYIFIYFFFSSKERLNYHNLVLCHNIQLWPLCKVNIYNYQNENELFPKDCRIFTFYEGHNGFSIQKRKLTS